MVDQASAFTPDALDRSAIEAGYAIEDVAAARARADERIRAVDALQPIKSTAKRAVVVAYLAVWASFGVAYLLNDAGSLDVDFAIFAVLSVALGIAVAMSFSVIRATRPDASRPTRALILLLVFPVILLVGVAGLCLPTAVPT
ncbi:MAG TPA: hypothetical protein VD763_02365 [Candidatus Saccharimonadales bacterium]|nr:hypothetical protein [Candidatus Saccharimonadales bacterium]